MRFALYSLLLLAFCADCSGGGTLATPPTASSHGIVAREPMRLHALAVSVCPSPAPGSSTTTTGSECTAERREDIPPLLNVLGLLVSQIPGYQPAELQAAYHLPSRSAGQGKTIAIVVPYDDPSAETDLLVYRTKFGLPLCLSLLGCFHKYSQTGTGALPPGDMNWGQEMSIDLDMASAICPNCKLDVVEANSDAPSDLLQAIITASSKLHATVVSNSWVTPEYSTEAADASQLASLSSTIVAAAGDQGYGAAFPAAASSVVAVGGTTLLQDSSTRGYSETVWSGTGGGCSAYIAKPAWQHDSGCANRTINDIAAIADPDPGVAVYDTYQPAGQGGWIVYGGTSVATPIVAGAIALSSNPVGANGAYIAGHSASLNAITQGSDGICDSAYLCSAVDGYSGPAGYGSPNGVGAL